MTHGANNNAVDPYGIPYALEIGVLKTNLPYEWVLIIPNIGFKRSCVKDIACLHPIKSITNIF
jgi:hypothetical protein